MDTPVSPSTSAPVLKTAYGRDLAHRLAYYALGVLPPDTQVGDRPEVTAGALADYVLDHLPYGAGVYTAQRVLDASACERRTPTAFCTFEGA